VSGEGEPPRYDRAVLVAVLVYHQRLADSTCSCGWGVLGASFADHVADVYEQARQFGLEGPQEGTG
jgi:hypothetical protein